MSIYYGVATTMLSSQRSRPMSGATATTVHIHAFATKGTGSNDELRLKKLLSQCEVDFLHFRKEQKLRNFLNLNRQLRAAPQSLIVMEGTGIAGGLTCLIARLFMRHRYVISSGDAVGPFVASHSRWAGPLFGLYERILCRFAHGYIGWTPYLVGRALTLGCRRGVTAAGWVIGSEGVPSSEVRQRTRQSWGVEPEDIVFGLLGSIDWNARKRYCYGLELVRAIQQCPRKDVKVVIIGDGTGLKYLKNAAGEELGRRVICPGRVDLDDVMNQLRGFDVASLPQSMDGVGAFRYTTKISEYQAAGLPIITARIPAAYDLPLGTCWRLPGVGPWDRNYIAALANLMHHSTHQSLQPVVAADGTVRGVFEEREQIERITHFMQELIQEIDDQNSA